MRNERNIAFDQETDSLPAVAELSTGEMDLVSGGALDTYMYILTPPSPIEE